MRRVFLEGCAPRPADPGPSPLVITAMAKSPTKPKGGTGGLGTGGDGGGDVGDVGDDSGSGSGAASASSAGWNLVGNGFLPGVHAQAAGVFSRADAMDEWATAVAEHFPAQVSG